MAETRMRVDRWLWAVRIFKSRTKATAACKSSRIRCNDKVLKPSTLITVGDKLEIRKDGFIMEFMINALIPKRVSATLAQPCYDNLTSEAEMNKFKDWFIGKAPAERRERGAGRPTKRERRTLEDFKDEVYMDEWFDSDSE